MQHALTARQFLRRHWLALVLVAAGAVILCAAVLLLRTMPPRTITMATGSEGGAYHEVGKFYRTILARSGVELQLQPTGGSVENLALLRNPRSGVSVALVQSGNAGESDANVIESLGTLFYEPLWLFYRSALRPLDIDTLQGRKVSVGPEGSGSRVVGARTVAAQRRPTASRRTALAHAAGRRGKAAQRRDRRRADAAVVGFAGGPSACWRTTASSWRASGMPTPMSRCSPISAR